jgi:hypothetical protein
MAFKSRWLHGHSKMVPARLTLFSSNRTRASKSIVPEDYMGDVIGDLNSRRGRVEGMEMQKTVQNPESTVSFRWQKCSAMQRLSAAPVRRAVAFIR